MSRSIMTAMLEPKGVESEKDARFPWDQDLAGPITYFGPRRTHASPSLGITHQPHRVALRTELAAKVTSIEIHKQGTTRIGNIERG